MGPSARTESHIFKEGKSQMETIELRDLYYIVIRRWPVIVAVTVLSALVSALVSIYALTPEYETFTTLMLGKPADYSKESQYSYQDVLTNQKLIGTYAEIAKSKVVMNQVVENLESDISVDMLRKMMNVTLLNNTEVIKITVKHTSPQMAEAITDEVAQVFMNSVSRIMQINNVQIIDKASLPNKPVSPKVKLNIAIAAVLGLMASLFGVFLIEAFDQTIKVPEDVEQVLNVPVIGMIPEQLK